MILTPFNTSNPNFWGLEQIYVNGVLIIRKAFTVPDEFNFLQHYCGKDPEGAKKYYGM